MEQCRYICLHGKKKNTRCTNTASIRSPLNGFCLQCCLKRTARDQLEENYFNKCIEKDDKYYIPQEEIKD
jgi:hypothetical protein